MPRLEIEIGGSSAGFNQAANQAFGILEVLQSTADRLKIDLFKASDVSSLNAIGGALTIVTGKIKEYTSAAIQGSAAFQDQKTTAVLDALNVKLGTLTGQSQIFGESIKNQRAQVSAYESAIAKLLSNGLNPADGKIIALKANIDALNATMSSNATTALNSQLSQTGGLIADAETRVKRLRQALTDATDTRSIAQYNIRLKTAQDELTRLKNIGVQVGTTLTNSANSASNAARKLSNGYNAVGLEFGRIIQDAPFAANNFGAIGNNITRLVEVLPGYIAQQRAIIVGNGGIATSGAVAKASLVAMFTGFGGVTIAISALVSAYTFYQQYVQKTKRDQDKLTGATLEYIETLKGVEKAQLMGAKAAQQDLVQLKALFKAYQDTTVPLEQRKKAYQQIQQLYPEYFKNIAFEQTATAKTMGAYNELTTSIIASAKARAAVNVITKNSERQLENENKLVKLNSEYAKEKAKLDAAQARRNVIGASEGAGTAALSGAQAQAQDRENRAYKATVALASTIKNIKKDTNLLSEQNLKLEKAANAEIKKGGTLVDLNKTKTAKAKKEPKDTLTPKIDKTTNDAELAGLVGNDVDVTKVRQKYEAIYEEINKAATKKGADRANLQALRDQAEINEAQEISQIIIAEKTRVENEVQRIENESGIKSSATREKELAQVQKWYDDQVIKAEGNAQILASIEEGKQAQIAFVNDKYVQKRLEAEAKLTDGIEKQATKSFTLNDNHTAKATRRIQDDLDKRLKAIKKYFDDLRKLYANDPIAQATLNLSEKAITNTVTTNAAVAADGGLSKELSRGVSKFGSDFFRVLTTINQQTDKTFSTIIGNLASSLTDSLGDVFVNILQKRLTAILEKAFEDLSSSQAALSGAAILAGSVISGAFSKTSSVGQAAGGGLKGAGTGALLGTAVGGPVGTIPGAIIGGVVGAIGGLFGAGKAKKQEELQKKQLAEAEKQTKLLERQNSLAYTSSIIGKMTDQGVVTGIEVNEFGKLTTILSGNDIAIVLERVNRTRQRGV